MKKLLLCSALSVCCCAAAFTACAKNDEGGLTKAEYAKVFNKTAEIMLGDSMPEATKTFGYIVNEDTGYIKSTAAFVYFMGELYKNDNFVLSDDPVKFTCSYGDDAFDISMLATCDREAGIVTGEISGTEDLAGDPSEFYICIEVNYDFKADTVTGFDISQSGWHVKPENAYCQSDIYRDGVMYTLSGDNDDERVKFTAAVAAKKSEYEKKLENVKDLKADFTDEYTRSMAIVVS